MDGKMLNSHGVDFLDGPLGLELEEKDLDEEETRRDMAKILKELKQKHPDKEVGNAVENILCPLLFFCPKCCRLHRQQDATHDAFITTLIMIISFMNAANVSSQLPL